MSENIFAKNLSYIKKYNPELAFKIENHAELKANYEILEAKSGDSVLLRENIPVHNQIDPLQEAIDVFQAKEYNEHKCISVVYGLGLGYLPKRFAKSCKGVIIIFEPDLDFLRITLEMVDFSEEFSKRNLIVANVYEDIDKAYAKFFFLGYKINLVYLDYHKHYDGTELQKLVAKLSDLHSIYQSNYNNLSKRVNIWTAASTESSVYTYKRHELAVLKNAFKGKTAVIISAGPSLNKNIELVKQNRSRFVVFCVGTALKKVLNYGITPDFVAIVECYESTMLQIKDLDLSDINLIIQPMTYKGIHKVKAKNIFTYFASNDNISNFLATLWGINPTEYINKGTVSVMALISAKILGCDKIILIGQDLAFTGGKCYAQGTIYESMECTIDKEDMTKGKVHSNDRQKLCSGLNLTIEQLDVHLDSKAENLTPVKGQIEPIVYAPSDYALYIKYFEQLAKDYGSEVKLINSTEGGAYLEGFEHIPLSDAIAKYAKEAIDVNKVLETIKPISENTFIQRRNKLLDYLNETVKVYELIIKDIEKANELGYEPYKQYELKGISIVKENPEKFHHYITALKAYYLQLSPYVKNNPLFSNIMVMYSLNVEKKLESFEEGEDYLEGLLWDFAEYCRKLTEIRHLVRDHINIWSLIEKLNDDIKADENILRKKKCLKR